MLRCTTSHPSTSSGQTLYTVMVSLSNHAHLASRSFYEAVHLPFIYGYLRAHQKYLDKAGVLIYKTNLLFKSNDAGWSSLVARWAHNPKVGGSNPSPATK
jgi:hypothetical protein